DGLGHGDERDPGGVAVALDPLEALVRHEAPAVGEVPRVGEADGGILDEPAPGRQLQGRGHAHQEEQENRRSTEHRRMLTRPWPPPPRPGGRIAPLAPRGGVTVRSMRTLPLLLSMLAGPAWAFPGTFVGPDGEAPAVEAAYVVLARQGDRTTLTVAPRLDAESPQVALVLPLPTGDVHHVADVPPSYLQRVTGF